MSIPAEDVRKVMIEVQERLRAGTIGKMAAAQMLLAVTPPEADKLPLENGIRMYFHCSACLREKPASQSPADWARLSVGFTKEGLQVWCWRHGLNVAHIHFEGLAHRARTDAGEPDPSERSQAGVTHDVDLGALLNAMEWGYKAHERGDNIQIAKEKFVLVLRPEKEKEPQPQPQYGVGVHIIEHALRGVYMGKRDGKPVFSATKRRSDAVLFQSRSAALLECRGLVVGRVKQGDLRIYQRSGLRWVDVTEEH